MIINNTNNNNNNNLLDNEEESMLTTIDNPYNPFIQFEQWYTFDLNHGYNSLHYLARIVKTSDELSDFDYSEAIENGIDEIVKLNPLGIYLKVTKESFKNRISSIKNELLLG